jgi:hypothetical protein
MASFLHVYTVYEVYRATYCNYSSTVLGFYAAVHWLCLLRHQDLLNISE